MSSAVDPLQLPGKDPRAAAAAGISPATQSSAIAGPTEQRVQAQDDRIAQFQAEGQKFAAAQDQLCADTKQQFDIMEQSAKEQFASANGALTHLQHEVDRSPKLSLRQNIAMMGPKMEELKQLLKTRCKREHDGKNDSRMDT